MHGQATIHGDLKGVRLRTPVAVLPSDPLYLSITKANILIDQDCHARLAGFGLLTIVSDPTNTITSISCAKDDPMRWMSPELLNPYRYGFEDSKPTTESDCYALGMVVYEVLSGQAPFAQFKDFITMRKVMEGERPEMPQGVEGAWFTADLWRMLTLCWETQPRNRPTIPAVLECLERVSKAWESPSHQAGEDGMGEDDWDLTTVNDSSDMLSRLDPLDLVLL